eukprot:359589-Chlamydomonas_euryale.AAC.3
MTREVGWRWDRQHRLPRRRPRAMGLLWNNGKGRAQQGMGWGGRAADQSKAPSRPTRSASCSSPLR